MPAPLTIAEIAKMIGVEEGIIRHTLERRDEDLTPYLCDPDAPGEADKANASPSQPRTALLDPEGLPLLITKLAFNIPTSDIIENLACQVVHLMLIQEENAGLTGKHQGLQEQNEQLQHRVKELQQRVEVLEAEAASRKGFWKLFGRRQPKNS